MGVVRMIENNKEIVKLEVEQFKRELQSYSWYCSRLIRVNDKLEYVSHKLSTVGAQSYDERLNNNFGYETPKLQLMIREEELIKKAEHWARKMNYCRNVLSLCDPAIKKILVMIFIEEINQSKVADIISKKDDYILSRQGMMYQVDCELKSILSFALQDD